MQLEKHTKILSVLFGTLVFAVTLILMIAVINAAMRAEAKTLLSSVHQELDTVANEATDNLIFLNSLGHVQCNDSTLLDMKRVLFDTSHAIDIGYIQDNQIVCTALGGLLAQPIDYSPADYIGPLGAAIRIVDQHPIILFDNRTVRVVDVNRGQFNFLVDTDWNIALNNTQDQWQVYYPTKGQIIHLVGTNNVHTKQREFRLFYGGFINQCHHVLQGYCAAVWIPARNFLARNIIQIVFSIVLCAVIAIGSGIFLHIWSITVRKVVYRVASGLKNNHFYWRYQPLIDLNTGEIIGCEVLARFKDRQGHLSPDEFMPLLRKKKQTWHFTQRMFSVALNDLEQASPLPDGFKISFNICPCDIERGIVRKIPTLPQVTGSRFNICLEITEEEYLDSTTAHELLQELVDEGLSISIDDFGTGYSNLQTLKYLSFHYLKIDRTFVMDIATEGLKKSIIPNIMDIVDKIGCTAIAEGIETQAQEDILKHAGVHVGQGWKYGKPMSAQSLVEFYRENRQQHLDVVMIPN